MEYEVTIEYQDGSEYTTTVEATSRQQAIISAIYEAARDPEYYGKQVKDFYATRTDWT